MDALVVLDFFFLHNFLNGKTLLTLRHMPLKFFFSTQPISNIKPHPLHLGWALHDLQWAANFPGSAKVRSQVGHLLGAWVA